MPSPVVTIGLPVYNAAPYLQDALRSIFAQSFADWELLAVDDGSTDGSAALIQGVVDARVRVTCDGRHLGLGARLNQITREARGKFLARMDADDLMHPDRLLRQLEHLERHPEIDALGCAMLVLDAGLRPVGVRRAPQQHAEICSQLASLGGMMHATVLARAHWAHAHPYRETLRHCEDQALWLSTCSSSHFANLPELLYFYREPAFSLHSYARAKRELMALLWRHRRLSRWRTAGAVVRHAVSLAAYSVASPVGLAPVLLRRRNQPLDPATRDYFHTAFARISGVRLPLVAARPMRSELTPV